MKRLIYVLSIVILSFGGSLAFASGLPILPHTSPTSTTTAAPSMTSIPTISPASTTPPPVAASPAPSVSSKASAPSAPSNSPTFTVLPIQHIPKVNPNLSTKPFEVGATAESYNYIKISLSDAICYALAHNLDIQGNRINIDIGRNSIKAANRLRNPYFVAFYNGGRAATDNPNSAGLMFPIDIAKRTARKNLAKANLELTKGNVALAEFYLRLDVRQAYVDLVAAKSSLKILNEQRKLLQELLDVAQKKYDAGAVPQMDVIQAKMTLNQLLIQVNSANTVVYVARYNFNKLLNSINFDTKEDYLPEQKDFIAMLTPKSVDRMPDFNEITAIALQKRIDLINAQKDIDVAQKNLKLVIRQRIPDVEIGGGYLFVPQALATDGHYSQGYYLSGAIKEIPLLYQYSPEIKNAKLQVDQKQIAYESLRKKAFMNLHSVYDEFITSQDNLNYYNDILLSQSKQFLQMAKRSYIVGKSSITDLIFIEQSYKSILMGYVDALDNYYNSWIDVVREVNDEDLKLHG